MMANIKGIQIVIAQLEHRARILNLIKTVFIKAEPIEVSLSATWDNATKNGWEKVVDTCLKHPHSHIALNNSDAVVGFRLSRILPLEKLKPDDSIYEWLMGDKLSMIVDRATAKWPEALKDGKKSWQFMALCVHPDYGGQGVASRMNQENLSLAKQLGCNSCTVIATNPILQKVFDKTGFDTIDIVKYADFKNEDGQPLFPVNDPKQTIAKFYAKKL